MQSIIDVRANAAEREALGVILQGARSEPSATMLTIYRAMCATVYEPVYMPIALDIVVGRHTARLDMPELIEMSIEPLKNPVTGAEHQARTDLPFGKEFPRVEVASGSTMATGAVRL